MMTSTLPDSSYPEKNIALNPYGYYPRPMYYLLRRTMRTSFRLICVAAMATTVLQILLLK